jgi:hypothetical protein
MCGSAAVAGVRACEQQRRPWLRFWPAIFDIRHSMPSRAKTCRKVGSLFERSSILIRSNAHLPIAL